MAIGSARDVRADTGFARLALGLALALLSAVARSQDAAGDPIAELRDAFSRTVSARVDPPLQARARYEQSLDEALGADRLATLAPQAVLLADRNDHVQSLFVLLRDPTGRWEWLGGSLISTGRVGAFDHFRTPVGVFEHGPANPDFRAEGTYNENHISGYGMRGMRVFDFGWVDAERGWGGGGRSPMRLQMHATDPDLFEPRLGQANSKGCIRIPASLNRLLDHRGILDAAYDEAVASGSPQWVLRADRAPVPWPGRYLVIVDSGATERPEWAMPRGASR
jgi:hypothetical protein